KCAVVGRLIEQQQQPSGLYGAGCNDETVGAHAQLTTGKIGRDDAGQSTRLVIQLEVADGRVQPDTNIRRFLQLLLEKRCDVAVLEGGALGPPWGQGCFVWQEGGNFGLLSKRDVLVRSVRDL